MPGLTDTEHIKNMAARLLDQRRQKERDIAEIDEALRVLGAVPSLLGSAPAKQIKSEAPAGKKHYNVNLAALVRQELAEAKYEEFINIGDMIDRLTKSHGVTGKRASLYAYIHSLLKEEEKKGNLKSEKGKGFFKTRKTEREATESELVASS